MTNRCFSFRLVAVIMTGLLSAACVKTISEYRTRPIRISTEPHGAEVWAVRGENKMNLGTTPITYNQKYEIRKKDFKNSHWWWLLAPLAIMGIGVAMFFAGEDAAATEDDPDKDSALVSLGMFGGIIGGGCTFGVTLISFTIGEVVAASDEGDEIRVKEQLVFTKDGYEEDKTILYSGLTNNVNITLKPAWYTRYGMKSAKDTESADSVPLLIMALKDDSPRVRAIAVEKLGELGSEALSAKPDLELLLNDKETLVSAAASKALESLKYAEIKGQWKKKPPSTTKEGTLQSIPIIAIFEVHDASRKIANENLVQLTSYLGTVMTQFGKYRVIPHDQLRARLFEEKKGTYKNCYDESCQIELGKSLAAQKTLATTLIQVGSKCAVTANLFDLKTETAEKGASVNTGCSPDELLDAMKQIAKQLSGE